MHDVSRSQFLDPRSCISISDFFFSLPDGHGMLSPYPQAARKVSESFKMGAYARVLFAALVLESSDCVRDYRFGPHFVHLLEDLPGALDIVSALDLVEGGVR